MRQATGKSGYLDVKLPAKSRGRGPRAWKAWKRRWIVLHGLHDLGTGGTVVTLDMYHNANVEGQQLERSTIYLEAVTLLQRAASRSHPYAFCIEAKQTVVHLAAACESDTQEWMDVFRNVLWPAAAILNTDAAFREAYPVAVIDTNFSALFGVRGGACLLLISDTMLLLRCTYTDHVLLEWPPTALARVYLANAPEMKDQGRVFVIEPRPHCGGWTAPLHFFSTKSQEIVKEITKSMRQGKRGDTLPRESCSRLPFYPEVLSACRSSYAGGFSLNLTESMEDLTSLNSEFLLTALYDQPRSNSTQFYPNTTISSDETDWEKSETPSQSYYDQPRMSFAGETETMIHDAVHESQDMNHAHSHHAPPSVRKSKSDSDLLDSGCRAINSKRTTRSDSTLELTLIATPTNNEPASIESENVILRNKRTRDCTPDNMESICSSLSSRDSGVQLSSLDESNATEKSVIKGATGEHSGYMGAEIATCQEEKPELDLQLEFLQMQQEKGNLNTDIIDEYHDLSNTSSRTSTSESSSHDDTLSQSSTNPGIYAEINSNRSSKSSNPEPMYEDLDRFRKDINKLLGIPQSPGQHLSKGGFQKGKEPPPLPPRCTRLDPKMGSSRKKDVIRFLGIDDPLAKEVIRVQQATATPSPKDGVRRKNLCRFLGVDSKTASAPVPDDLSVKSQRPGSIQHGSTDGTYDVPPNQLRYMAPSNPKLQRGESRSRKFSGNLLRLFKDKETESQFYFPPASSDMRSQTLPANRSSLHRSPSTGAYHVHQSALGNTNNAPIMFGKSTSPELAVRGQGTKNPQNVSREDNAAPVKPSNKTTQEDLTNIYIKFAQDLTQEILNKVKESLSATSTQSISNNMNETNLYKDEEANKVALSTTGADELDPVYLDMTAKLRHFVNAESVNTNRESAMYQAMFLRTLSNASYISIDMNRVQSMIACSAKDADLAAELRSENSSSDFLKFAQELAEMSKAFNETEDGTSSEDCFTVNSDICTSDTSAVSFLTKTENEPIHELADTDTAESNTDDSCGTEQATSHLDSDCVQIMVTLAQDSDIQQTCSVNNNEETTSLTEPALTVENSSRNYITPNCDSTPLNEETLSEKDATALTESNNENENENHLTPIKEAKDLACTELNNTVSTEVSKTPECNGNENASNVCTNNCESINILQDEVAECTISETCDEAIQQVFCPITNCATSLKNELSSDGDNIQTSLSSECCSDCLIENWALYTAEVADPVQSLTLHCQQAQVVADDTTDNIDHQFVSILCVCLRNDVQENHTLQENSEETGFEQIPLDNVDIEETIFVSADTEDVTRPVSPVDMSAEEIQTSEVDVSRSGSGVDTDDQNQSELTTSAICQSDNVKILQSEISPAQVSENAVHSVVSNKQESFEENEPAASNTDVITFEKQNEMLKAAAELISQTVILNESSSTDANTETDVLEQQTL